MDNVEINIKAIVQGLDSVRILVREIEKLPGAGAGIKGLSAQFASVQKSVQDTIRELDRAGNEIKALGADTQRVMQQAAVATSKVPTELGKVTRSAGTAKQSLASIATSAGALGRAVEQALSGNVLGAITSVGTALRSSLNFDLVGSKVAAGTAKVSKSVGDTEKVLTRFSSVLGTAAKSADGTLNAKLFTDFGIKAEQALTNPEIALKQFVTGLSTIPDASDRATEAANVFGASTASLLPTLEAMVATEIAATEAAAVLASAQTDVAAATTALETATATATAAEDALVTLEASAIATDTELAAARDLVTTATELRITAEEALAAAIAQVVAAEEAAVVASGEVIAAEVAVEAAGAPLIATVGAVAVAIAAVLAAAGGAVLIGAALGKSFADAGTKMQDLSEKSGVTVESLSALKLAAGESKVEFSKLETALPRFAKNLAEAEGGNKSLTFSFKQMGIDVKGASKNIDGALSTFTKYANGLATDGQKTDAFVKAFGKSGADLIPIFNRVGGNLAAFREEVAKLGGMTSEQAANAAKFTDSYEVLTFTLTNLKNQIGAELLPTLTDLADNLVTFIKDNKQGFSDLAAVITGVFNFAIATFLAFGGTVAFLSNLMYGLINVVIAAAQEFISLGAATIKLGQGVAQFIGGDIAGAVKTIENASRDATEAIRAMSEELQRSATIISQPTFKGLFSFLNGGDGRTSKTFGSKPPPTTTFKGGSGQSKKTKVDPEIKALRDAQLAYQKASIQAEADILQDGLKHEQEVIQANYSQNLISAKEYYDSLNNIQLRSNQVRINEQQQLLALEKAALGRATKGSERVKIETDILRINTDLEKLYKNQGVIVALNTVEVAKQARAYNDMITDIKDQLLDLEGRTSESASDRIDKQFRDSLEKAQAKADNGEAGGQADVDRINRLKDLLKAQGKYLELENAVKIAESARGIKEDELNTQVAEGLKTRQQANEELAKYETDETARIEDMVAGMQHFAEKVGDPALLQAVAKIRLELANWKVSDAARTVADTKNQIQLAQDALDTYNQKIENAVKDGTLSDQQAFQLREAAVASYKEKLAGLLDTLAAIARQTKDADLQGFVDATRASLEGLKADGDATATALNSSFAGAFVDFFTAIKDGSESAADAFANFGRSILKTLSDLALKVLLYKYLFPLLGLDINADGSGGSGGIGGILSGIFGGGKARGGLIDGRPGTDQNLTPTTTGEFIVNRAATAQNLELLQGINDGINPRRALNAGSNFTPAAATAAGQGGTGQLNIVNVLPGDLLDNHIQHGQGKTTLLNFIEDNKTAINSRLG